jgi:small subunit ribosomal protein S16
MAVVIRMKRTGRKNAPCYRISVADKSAPRDGRTLDTLGVYDPISPREELRLKLDVERARDWVQRGAKPSETVHSIFKRTGVYEGVQMRDRKRDRSGRQKETASGKARTAAKTSRAEAKVARRTERVGKKRAAAKAAKESAAEAAE